MQVFSEHNATASPPYLQVRHELEQGRSVKYLLPDSVIQYIYQHGLYNTAAHRPPLLRVGEQKVDTDTD